MTNRFTARVRRLTEQINEVEPATDTRDLDVLAEVIVYSLIAEATYEVLHASSLAPDRASRHSQILGWFAELQASTADVGAAWARRVDTLLAESRLMHTVKDGDSYGAACRAALDRALGVIEPAARALA